MIDIELAIAIIFAVFVAGILIDLHQIWSKVGPITKFVTRNEHSFERALQKINEERAEDVTAWYKEKY